VWSRIRWCLIHKQAVTAASRSSATKYFLYHPTKISTLVRALAENCELIVSETAWENDRDVQHDRGTSPKTPFQHRAVVAVSDHSILPRGGTVAQVVSASVVRSIFLPCIEFGVAGTGRHRHFAPKHAHPLRSLYGAQ
jgi:hypothetical protein